MVRLFRLTHPAAPKDFLDCLSVQKFIAEIRDIEKQFAFRNP